jgi:hypothetical protein
MVGVGKEALAGVLGIEMCVGVCGVDESDVFAQVHCRNGMCHCNFRHYWREGYLEYTLTKIQINVWSIAIFISLPYSKRVFARLNASDMGSM